MAVVLFWHSTVDICLEVKPLCVLIYATGHHYWNAQALPAIQQRMFNPFRQTLVDGNLHQTLLTEKRDSMAII